MRSPWFHLYEQSAVEMFLQFQELQESQEKQLLLSQSIHLKN